MKFIITEDQYRRLNKSSQSISNAIEKYMNSYISDGHRKITPKPRNYGNLREDWCIDGHETITAIYFFNEDVFNHGSLYVSNKIVKSLSKLLNIRQSYVLNTIAEWYDETMVPKFEQIVGESGLSIEDIDTSDNNYECIPEPVKEEGITEEEMIQFIVKNTLYDEYEVKEKIESGETTLEDLYLHVKDIVKRKEVTGF
jgi:hypothetical protein